MPSSQQLDELKALLLPADADEGIGTANDQNPYLNGSRAPHEGSNNSKLSSTQVGARPTSKTRNDAALKVPWRIDQNPHFNGDRAPHEGSNNSKLSSNLVGACLTNTTRKDAATKVPWHIGLDVKYNTVITHLHGERSDKRLVPLNWMVGASLPDITLKMLAEVARYHTTCHQKGGGRNNCHGMDSA